MSGEVATKRWLEPLRWLGSRWTRWVRFLSREEAATPLALVRISIGAITLHTLLSIYGHDLMAPLWGNLDEGGILDLSDSNWLVQRLGGASLETSHTLVWACMAASALLIIGVGSRIAALVALQTLIALFSLHPGSGGGHDRLMTNILWLLVFARSDATLSLWCWLRHRRPPSCSRLLSDSEDREERLQAELDRKFSMLGYAEEDVQRHRLTLIDVDRSGVAEDTLLSLRSDRFPVVAVVTPRDPSGDMESPTGGPRHGGGGNTNGRRPYS